MWWTLYVCSALLVSFLHSLNSTSDHEVTEGSAEEALDETTEETVKPLPYKIGRHVKYSVRDENISHIDKESVLDGWMQTGPDTWNLLQFQHSRNNYSVRGVPLFARDEAKDWYKFAHPPLVLQHHLEKLPVYKGVDEVNLTAEDFKLSYD